MLDFFKMIGDFFTNIWTFLLNFLDGFGVFVTAVSESAHVVPTFAHLMPGILSGSMLAVGFIGAVKGIFGR